MAAVIRLKRRVDEDPLNAFVLNCKRQRTELPEVIGSGGDVAGEVSTVLKFAGTFTKADNIHPHLQQRLSKEEAKEAISRVHRPTIASRNRAATRQNAQNNRFRIVNCTRSLSQVDGAEGTTIVDVERDIEPVAAGSSFSTTDASSDGATQKPPVHNESSYVYDLYVADDSEQQTHIPYIPENLEDISVAIYDDPLYSSHRCHGENTSDEESEDSNDENNWRNDYPDEDEDVFGDANSVDEDDMRRAVQDLDIDGENELSSDDEDYANGGDSSGFAYPPGDGDDDLYEYREDDDEGVNPTDVARFGPAYAKYKARILKQSKMNTDEYDSEIGCSDSSSSTSESENFDLYD
ncbi:probable RNA polymerase II nuclear localization protein SLC7A6OS isoform X2 [Topomyia yanbarensis]|uniref:probable RNA polymerase II nuclear localization protein SLC7A6OS isoform X2 n=1 Tax=Topomyia yanbarensis TaxID=2498891 RepID=UPI00273C2931|nr:probable RNA polymerase II nuclear localization protein SLC7A6OS isoform X2 [Topomyia yanbarensis]